MSRKKKSRNQDTALQTIILITAILKLIEIMMEIIKILIE